MSYKAKREPEWSQLTVMMDQKTHTTSSSLVFQNLGVQSQTLDKLRNKHAGVPHFLAVKLVLRACKLLRCGRKWVFPVGALFLPATAFLCLALKWILLICS